MKRRFLGALIASSLLVAALAGPVAAGGVNPAQLQKAGWTCFNVPGLGVHCTPPGGSGNATAVLYFGGTSDPGATDAAFSGTELLLAPDVYNTRNTPPCPQEGLDAWTNLGFAFACHRR